MSDLRKQYSLDYLLASKSHEYIQGYNDCKKDVLEILKKELTNLDLSTDNCDSRYIEKIKKL